MAELPPPGGSLGGAYDRLASLANGPGAAFQREDEAASSAKRKADAGAGKPAKRGRQGSPDGSRSPGSATDSEEVSISSELPMADGANVNAPLAPVARTRNLAPSPDRPLSLPAGQTPRILITDDSYTVRRFMQRTFEQRGYAVDVAQNGWQAFAQMQTRLYDFVFLDIEMPVMNGYRCAQAIRKWEARVDREQKQFICALTSHSKPSERELGMGIGMNLFEAKPAKPKRLLGIVERALAAANGDAAAAAAIAAAATARACLGNGQAGALGLEDEEPEGGLRAGAAAQMALCTSAGLGWLDVRIAAARPGAYDVEAADGSGLRCAGVPARRVRAPGAAFLCELPLGTEVDLVRGGLLPGRVVAASDGKYDVSLGDGSTASGVARDQLLAAHADPDTNPPAPLPVLPPPAEPATPPLSNVV